MAETLRSATSWKGGDAKVQGNFCQWAMATTVDHGGSTRRAQNHSKRRTAKSTPLSLPDESQRLQTRIVFITQMHRAVPYAQNPFCFSQILKAPAKVLSRAFTAVSKFNSTCFARPSLT